MLKMFWDWIKWLLTLRQKPDDILKQVIIEEAKRLESMSESDRDKELNNLFGFTDRGLYKLDKDTQ